MTTLISLSKLRDRLRLRPEEDGSLKDIHSTIVELWERETARKWERRTAYVETLRTDHPRLSTLFTELWPIETLTKIEEKSLTDTTWTELKTDGYVHLRDNRIERIGAYWAPLVRLTYTGGYVASPTGIQQKTPGDVHEALLLQAEFMTIRHSDGKIAVKSQNFEGGAGVYEEAFLHPTFAKLAELRRRKV